MKRQIVSVPGLFALILSLALHVAAQQPSTLKSVNLTIQVENVNQDAGNIGVLVFKSTRGWPEDRFAALKDIVVPAHPGTVTVLVPALQPGDYAIALVHDVNRNHLVDKNIFGKPKEQWGMSNNPHATLHAPSFDTARIHVQKDMEIHVKLQ